ncbi:MAG: hypothetical protein EZS28_018520 [Streblomastix strix]|uniref:Uncharacterized protein n=1 Tax=Streblomastix strix TaxID=222440 RepID=A0A5J4VU51_9EUKA|nr:MAG: hypothetical protein EZS28_018520 [Streblomastix strix]
MISKSNNTGRRQLSQDSYKTLNYVYLVLQSLLQVVAQPQPSFVNAFGQNVEIDSLGPDQTSATLDEVSSKAITAARTLLLRLSGQDTSQIDFYNEKLSEKQVVKAMQCVSAATDLVTKKRPPKYNFPTMQSMLAFDRVIADLERKLMQQY